MRTCQAEQEMTKRITSFCELENSDFAGRFIHKKSKGLQGRWPSPRPNPLRLQCITRKMRWAWCSWSLKRPAVSTKDTFRTRSRTSRAGFAYLRWLLAHYRGNVALAKPCILLPDVLPLSNYIIKSFIIYALNISTFKIKYSTLLLEISFHAWLLLSYYLNILTDHFHWFQY